MLSSRHATRLAAVVATALAALAAAGCGGAEESADGAREAALQAALDDLRKSESPIFYAGRRVAGLPLTHVEGDARRGSALFVYGSCEVEDPDGLGPEGGSCSPPAQIQVGPFEGRLWARAVGCTADGSLRGVPAARHDGLVLFTGGSIVKIYAPDADTDLAVVAALRDLDGAVDPATPLPQPVAEVRRVAGRACGLG